VLEPEALKATVSAKHIVATLPCNSHAIKKVQEEGRSTNVFA
jgi:hypothetical protein